MAGLVEVFCRSIGGRVTSVEMSPDEAAVAVSRQPWTWSLSQRSFAPWPDFNYRGDPVPDPTIVGGKLDKAGIWNSVP
jgi:hypothetical protein